MIPKILHFCFGMAPDFGGKEWGLSHFVSVSSAISKIRPSEAYIYYQYDPNNEWWAETKKLIDTVKITAPVSIFGNPVDHPAHRADVVRLEKLKDKGGIYLDSDVVVHKSFDGLLNNKFVLGAEGRRSQWGTANAVILSESDSEFLNIWYNEYKSFRGSSNKYWNEHSVQLPFFLSKKHSDLIHIADYRAFFWPLWSKRHIEWIFNSVKPCTSEHTYAVHLWEGKSFRYTENLTPGDVRRHETNYHLWARPYLQDLPDDFGQRGAVRPWEQRRQSRLDILEDDVKNFLRTARSKIAPRRFER